MLFISERRRQRQEEFREFELSPVHKESSRHRVINPVSKQQKLKNKKKKKKKDSPSYSRALTLEVSLTLPDCGRVVLEIMAPSGDWWHTPTVIPAFGK